MLYNYLKPYHMSTTRHTKGQWEFQPTTIKNEFIIKPLKDEFGDFIFEDNIAKINPSRSDSRANAKLIAASPELLQIAFQFQEYLKSNGSVNSLIYRQIDLAIKKATE